jgi:hypothetical protein
MSISPFRQQELYARRDDGSWDSIDSSQLHRLYPSGPYEEPVFNRSPAQKASEPIRSAPSFSVPAQHPTGAKGDRQP